MATVQDIIDSAAARSNLNDSTLIAPADYLRAVSSFERRIYLTAARENPDFFGREATTAARGSSTATWNIASTPGNVAAVSEAVVAAITGTVSGISVGTRVNLISRRQPHVEIAPRIYLRDKVIYEYNSELQANSSNYVTQLKLFYSYLPPIRTDLSDVLDVPEEHESLVILPLARLMALRDQRPDEIQAIDEEFKLDWITFTQHLTVYDEGAVRDLTSVRAAARLVDNVGS